MRFFRFSSLLLMFALCGLAQSPGGLFGGSGSVTALAVAPNGYTPFASGATTLTVPHSYGVADFSPMVVQCWTGSGTTWTPMFSGWTISGVGASTVTVAFSPAAPAAGGCKVNFAGGVGPAGPQGPIGPTGATGPAGPASTTAADIISGVFNPARLGTGTANSTTILYGDNVWRPAPSGGTGGGVTPNGTSGQFLTSNGNGGFGTPITANTGGNGQILTSNGSGGFGTPINASQFAPTIHQHSASDIITGTIAANRLGASGTRDNTTVLFGDNVWRTLPASGATLPNTTSILKGNNTGGAVAAVAGSDYQAPITGTCSVGSHADSVNPSTGAIHGTPDTGSGGGVAGPVAAVSGSAVNVTCAGSCYVNGVSFPNLSASVAGFPNVTRTDYIYTQGGTVKYGYNGTAPSTLTTVTGVNGVTAMPTGDDIVPIAVVSLNAGVPTVTDARNALVAVPPVFVEGSGISLVRAGRQITINATAASSSSGSGSGVSQSCFRVNSNQSALAAGTTRVVVTTPLTLPANSVVLGSWIKTNIAFSGVAGAGVSIGNSVSDTAYANVYDLTQGVTSTNIQAETGFGANTSASHPVLLIFTGGTNLSNLTSGQVDACVMYQEITAEGTPTVL